MPQPTASNVRLAVPGQEPSYRTLYLDTLNKDDVAGSLPQKLRPPKSGVEDPIFYGSLTTAGIDKAHPQRLHKNLQLGPHAQDTLPKTFPEEPSMRPKSRPSSSRPNLSLVTDDIPGTKPRSRDSRPRDTNPLDPRYKLATNDTPSMRPRSPSPGLRSSRSLDVSDIDGAQPKKRSVSVPRSAGLDVSDIEGAQPGWAPRHRLVVRRDNDPFVNKFERRQYRSTNNVADIPGAHPRSPLEYQEEHRHKLEQSFARHRAHLHAQKVLREMQMDRHTLERTWDALKQTDTDKAGLIEADKFRAVLTECGAGVSGEEVDVLVEGLADNAGYLDYRMFARTMLRKVAPNDERLRPADADMARPQSVHRAPWCFDTTIDYRKWDEWQYSSEAPAGATSARGRPTSATPRTSYTGGSPAGAAAGPGRTSRPSSAPPTNRQRAAGEQDGRPTVTMAGPAGVQAIVEESVEAASSPMSGTEDAAFAAAPSATRRDAAAGAAGAAASGSLQPSSPIREHAIRFAMPAASTAAAAEETDAPAASPTAAAAQPSSPAALSAGTEHSPGVSPGSSPTARAAFAAWTPLATEGLWSMDGGSPTKAGTMSPISTASSPTRAAAAAAAAAGPDADLMASAYSVPEEPATPSPKHYAQPASPATVRSQPASPATVRSQPASPAAARSQPASWDLRQQQPGSPGAASQPSSPAAAPSPVSPKLRPRSALDQELDQELSRQAESLEQIHRAAMQQKRAAALHTAPADLQAFTTTKADGEKLLKLLTQPADARAKRDQTTTTAAAGPQPQPPLFTYCHTSKDDLWTTHAASIATVPLMLRPEALNDDDVVDPFSPKARTGCMRGLGSMLQRQPSTVASASMPAAGAPSRRPKPVSDDAPMGFGSSGWPPQPLAYRPQRRPKSATQATGKNPDVNEGGLAAQTGGSQAGSSSSQQGGSQGGRKTARLVVQGAAREGGSQAGGSQDVAGCYEVKYAVQAAQQVEPAGEEGVVEGEQGAAVQQVVEAGPAVQGREGVVSEQGREAAPGMQREGAEQVQEGATVQAEESREAVVSEPASKAEAAVAAMAVQGAEVAVKGEEAVLVKEALEAADAAAVKAEEAAKDAKDQDAKDQDVKDQDAKDQNEKDQGAKEQDVKHQGAKDQPTRDAAAAAIMEVKAGSGKPAPGDRRGAKGSEPAKSMSAARLATSMQLRMSSLARALTPRMGKKVQPAAAAAGAASGPNPALMTA